MPQGERPWPYENKPVKSELMFMDADEGITVSPESGAPVKVRVRSPFRIVHQGNVYVGGDTFEVPSSKTLYRWLQGGWVERLPAPKPKTQTKETK